MLSLYQRLPETCIYAESLLDRNWNIWRDLLLQIATEYNRPGRIDILLDVWVFVDVIHHGRQCGLCNIPTALKMEFGCLLTGNTGSQPGPQLVTTLPNIGRMLCCWLFQLTLLTWPDGRFVVPLPKCSITIKLVESCSQAVHCFLSFELFIHSKSIFTEV